MDSKKVDKWLIILSGLFLVVGLFLVLIYIGIMGRPNTLELSVGILGFIIFLFSLSYLVLSILTSIFNLIFKKLSNHFTANVLFKVIFSILFVIIISVVVGSIPSLGKYGNSVTSTKQLLRNQINNPGSLMCTDTILFTKEDSTLSAQSISKDSGFESNHIYFNNGDLLEFEITDNNKLLKYIGASSKKKIKICIICDEGKTGLQEALTQNGINTTIDSNIEGQTLCLVYPQRNT